MTAGEPSKGEKDPRSRGEKRLGGQVSEFATKPKKSAACN
jgi:hypothetical protein